MMNGNDDFHDDKDTENFDMSPPAKKPSPSIMGALPGMSDRVSIVLAFSLHTEIT